MRKLQRIRDPLHDLIEFDVGGLEIERVLWDVIQTRPFQRLRRIKQLGFSELVYPGATHSRLMHSVGVFHTARRLLRVIEEHGTPQEAKGQQALAAALLHDVGHGPFSHAFEEIGKRLKLKFAHHEAVSDALIRHGEIADCLRDMGSGFHNDVADMVSGRGGKTIYSSIVSSQFDADRLDYMQRDRLMTGTKHAGIDFEWLVRNLEVDEVSQGVAEVALMPLKTFVLGSKAVSAAESYVLGLFQLYPAVYLHKATRGVEKIFAALLERVIALVQDGSLESTGLPAAHSIVRFARSPDELENALALDDTVLWGTLSTLADAKDECVRTLSMRLRDRKLFKCIDVRGRIASVRNDLDAVSAGADEVCETIGSKIALEYPGQECLGRGAVPRVLADKAERSPYRTMSEERGAILNQVVIRTDGGRLADLSRRSPVVAELKPFKAFRIYFDRDDHDTKTKLERIIDEEIGRWPA